MCRGFFCSSTSTCGALCRIPLFPLCFAESIPCAPTVEVYPRGPWTVITFRHLFVKVNDGYVRFIVQSLPPFAASNNFSCEVSRLYLGLFIPEMDRSDLCFFSGTARRLFMLWYVVRLSSARLIVSSTCLNDWYWAVIHRSSS